MHFFSGLSATRRWSLQRQHFERSFIYAVPFKSEGVYMRLAELRLHYGNEIHTCGLIDGLWSTVANAVGVLVLVSIYLPSIFWTSDAVCQFN